MPSKPDAGVARELERVGEERDVVEVGAQRAPQRVRLAAPDRVRRVVRSIGRVTPRQFVEVSGRIVAKLLKTGPARPFGVAQQQERVPPALLAVLAEQVEDVVGVARGAVVGVGLEGERRLEVVGGEHVEDERHRARPASCRGPTTRARRHPRPPRGSTARAARARRLCARRTARASACSGSRCRAAAGGRGSPSARNRGARRTRGSTRRRSAARGRGRSRAARRRRDRESPRDRRRPRSHRASARA